MQVNLSLQFEVSLSNSSAAIDINKNKITLGSMLIGRSPHLPAPFNFPLVITPINEPIDMHPKIYNTPSKKSFWGVFCETLKVGTAS